MSFLPWNHCEASLPETLVDQAMLPECPEPLSPKRSNASMFCMYAMCSAKGAKWARSRSAHFPRIWSSSARWVVGRPGPPRTEAGKPARRRRYQAVEVVRRDHLVVCPPECRVCEPCKEYSRLKLRPGSPAFAFAVDGKTIPTAAEPVQSSDLQRRHLGTVRKYRPWRPVAITYTSTDCRRKEQEVCLSTLTAEPSFPAHRKGQQNRFLPALHSKNHHTGALQASDLQRSRNALFRRLVLFQARTPVASSCHALHWMHKRKLVPQILALDIA